MQCILLKIIGLCSKNQFSYLRISLIIFSSVFNLYYGQFGITFTLGLFEPHYQGMTSELIPLSVLYIKENSPLWLVKTQQ